MSAHVLVLGGTTEARVLVADLAGRAGVRVTTSLAGRVGRPGPLAGEVRTGGFGGPEGLAAWLRAHRVTALVDATHPFAQAITAHAVRAAESAAVPLVVVRRPGWCPVPGDRWHPVESLAEAAELLPDLGRRVLLTVGRTGIGAFAHLRDVDFVARCVEPPKPPLPPRVHIVLDRGPFTVEEETALLRAHRVETLVAKDSGGSATSAKLAAARDLALPVVVVRRPPLPEGVWAVTDVPGVLDRLGLRPT
ncbi:MULTISPECIES: cobalt-precorrin-6A reductase [unclassified Streptomyces]|uniref:cobalt-precorrin-6A reductase n=1 Tax=unclassified Streptomyces TaxID=2593676 RepID=UPI0019085720|nr:cobalt-precorrin-6A reductase [Streptomyces sp. HSG2]